MQRYGTVGMNYIQLSAHELSDEVPVTSTVMLKAIITFSPTWRGGPAKLKQGEPPLRYRVASASFSSALSNVNDAPTIASAKKVPRSCDKKRFCFNQQFVFMQTSKGTGNQSSGILWRFGPEGHELHELSQISEA